MLAVASNLFGKSSSLSAYTLDSAAPSPSSSATQLPSGSRSTDGPSQSNPLNVGLWKVVGATHKTTGKHVSVWIFEKRMLDLAKGDGGFRSNAEAKDFVLERLKKEATSLSRLRHPDILHMVEPLEDSRTELTFVTETIISSLETILTAAAGPSRRTGKRPPEVENRTEVDLDEVEIQKGTLQIAKGLSFLHQQAKLVHLNIAPSSIMINAKGDWKLSGLGMTTPLTRPDGTPSKYVYPEVDTRIPPQIQWKMDYLAPEYALDYTLTPSNDLYSLGCVLYAVHMGGRPPFRNHGSMQSLRDNAEGSLFRKDWMNVSRWNRCSAELRDLLPRLLTRHPSNRISLASLPSHSFFSSLAISTLNFLDATTFASKPREEKATFLRGLVRVLPTFSDRLRKGKILPSLLEEMKDTYLLPFILPNVFEVSNTLSKSEFTPVLSKLQPLFGLRDPPQNMLTLLEHLTLFEEKTDPPLFREHVMPLIYNALECEHLPVQEKALKVVPHLCEILDYGTVQNVLLVKVAILFTRTRILSVKVQTLECFTAMVKTLDKATLTTKMVPQLAKIKTKAMGAKVDREAIATLVLPQLWAMSMGPLLNADQFGRFMTVIKSLGIRVEQEHSQHLRDVGRIEQQTSSFAGGVNGSAFSMNGPSGNGEVDFEALVKGQNGIANPLADAAPVDPWDEGWADSGESDATLSQAFPGLSMTSTPASSSFLSSPIPTATAPSSSFTATASVSRLKARPVPASTFDSSAFASPPSAQSSQLLSPGPASRTPSYNASHQHESAGLAPLQPQRPAAQRAPSGNAPNYNISLSPHPLTPSQPSNSLSFVSPAVASLSSPHSAQSTFKPMQTLSTMQSSKPTMSSPAIPAVQPPPGWSSGVMKPTVAPKPTIPSVSGNQNWGDFDPLN
ncbi:kinase-like domain-containing protein [Kockovaella imperatae]|uniref:Kinase-like domain-containing protein n=1 Tax=Kockovaella imperatae TaxID=4999 RepID=A0A1Y1U827_9TREE|nr:kinase-like domain-containing protein [Kockovaella imperatae]ORX34162.1 kinase-like domain-containing protein [Kockovaella imperatae]